MPHTILRVVLLSELLRVSRYQPPVSGRKASLRLVSSLFSEYYSVGVSGSQVIDPAFQALVTRYFILFCPVCIHFLS